MAQMGILPTPLFSLEIVPASVGKCLPKGLRFLVCCRFVPKTHVRKQSATDGRDLNIGVSPGFGGLIQGQIYNPKDSGRKDWGTLGKIRGITTTSRNRILSKRRRRCWVFFSPPPGCLRDTSSFQVFGCFQSNQSLPWLVPPSQDAGSSPPG